MKINANSIILILGILGIALLVWFTRPAIKTNNQAEEYSKIDSAIARIEQRQIRDSIRNHKADSLLLVVSQSNGIIAGFANELNKINKQLGQTITNINSLNANELVKFYSGQLPPANSK